jgi:low affinity Fe/Cu permease
MGTSWAIFLASVVGGCMGHHRPGFSDTWQLVINTGTSVVTFLMVFLIQATQNRDSKAIHLKLDELLRAIAKARTGLIGIEHMSKEELKRLEQEFISIKAKQTRQRRMPIRL